MHIWMLFAVVEVFYPNFFTGFLMDVAWSSYITFCKCYELWAMNIYRWIPIRIRFHVHTRFSVLFIRCTKFVVCGIYLVPWSMELGAYPIYNNNNTMIWQLPIRQVFALVANIASFFLLLLLSRRTIYLYLYIYKSIFMVLGALGARLDILYYYYYWNVDYHFVSFWNVW